MKQHQDVLKLHGSTILSMRSKLIKHLQMKLDEPSVIMQPIAHDLLLSSSKSTKVVTFSSEDMTTKMISNKELFHTDNALLDPG